MLRLFIGIKIEPPAFLIEHLSNLKKTLYTSLINWVDPLNYHITLKFLGDVEENKINSITASLEQLAKGTGIFTLEYNRLGFFGSQKQPRILWFGFKKHHEIDHLQSLIDKALTDSGFEPEEKEFHPHLTLARIKRITDSQPLLDYLDFNNPESKGKYTIHGFQLIRSILRPDGPDYKVLKEFKLAKFPSP